MPLYESVFIARQDISSTQAEGLTETFAELITGAGGTIRKKEYWGLRNLAYRIKKNRKGHYALLGIDAEPAAITEMERNMRIHDDVLRFLTIRVDEIDEGPSAILKSRDERGGRGGRGRRDEGGRERRERREESHQDRETADRGEAADKGDDK